MSQATGSKASIFQVCSLLLLLTPAAGRTADAPHAQAQLAALLGDRPKLATSLEARPEVRDWILRRFSEAEPPLFWDPAAPVSGRAAEWDAGNPARTLLRVDAKPGGIDQLTHLLFELHNVQGYAAFAAIHEEAVLGAITRDEYAWKMLEQEFRALTAARAFYREFLADLSPSEQQEARSYYRLMHGTSSLEEHVTTAIKRGVDLRDHYRRLYDSLVLAERESRRRLGKE